MQFERDSCAAALAEAPNQSYGSLRGSYSSVRMSELFKRTDLYSHTTKCSIDRTYTSTRRLYGSVLIDTLAGRCDHRFKMYTYCSSSSLSILQIIYPRPFIQHHGSIGRRVALRPSAVCIVISYSLECYSSQPKVTSVFPLPVASTPQFEDPLDRRSTALVTILPVSQRHEPYPCRSSESIRAVSLVTAQYIGSYQYSNMASHCRGLRMDGSSRRLRHNNILRLSRIAIRL